MERNGQQKENRVSDVRAAGVLLPGSILYGGDYNPEQWLDRPDILKEDIRLMREAHIGAVSLGIFSWSFLEREEGQYDLGWLKEIVDRLYEHEIRVILATPSGARPRWLAERYPEVLRVNERRERALYGARHNHCYTSPVYREKVRLIDRKLAECFGEHPGVILWHISNEYGGECHCPLCQEEFRLFLREKYGSIEALNRAYWSAFWSHSYNSFEQVESPSTLGDTNLHGLNLDFKRFVSERTTDFMRHEIRALREGGAKQPVTTNFMQNFAGLDYAKMAEHVDIVSWDNYPFWQEKPDDEVLYATGFEHDFMRCLKMQPYLMMESSPSSLNWQSVSTLKRPGVLALQSLQAVAHGSDSVLYFQIRQGRGSSEKFHGALIDHYGGSDTRVFREAEALGRDLMAIREVAGAGTNAQAAVLYDMENRWAMEDAEGPRNCGLHYREAALKAYQALRKCGLNTDVIDAGKDLSAYRILAVPMLYMFRDGVEERIREFVAGGGTLLMTYWSGIADATDLCYMGKTPHGLTDVLGLRFEEIDALFDGAKNHLLPAAGWTENGEAEPYSCEHLCELILPEGAETLMTYAEDFYAGYPALTVNRYGEGRAYYLCADAEQRLYDELLARLVRESGLVPLLANIPPHTAVSSRRAGDVCYLFVQHFARDTVKIEMPEGAEVLCGGPDGAMEGYATLVLRLKM